MLRRASTGRPGGPAGFTLVELVVVIAILGVLASIAVALVTNYLSTSQEQAYNADLERIQGAVDAFHTNPANVRFQGRPQYPLLGALKTTGSLSQPDSNPSCDTVTIAGNPLGGAVGGKPRWFDDGNGVRDPAEEVLKDEDCPDSSTGWHVAPLTLQGTLHIVDSRDYFINFDPLVAQGYLDRVPSAASSDNKPPGSTNTYQGPYSWYVDAAGKVRSLLFVFPEPDRTGFEGGSPLPPATPTATPSVLTPTPSPVALTPTPSPTATPGPAVRVTGGLVVLYNLDEGVGEMVHDVSQVGDPLDLAIANLSGATWISGGLSINSSTIVSSAGPATKVFNMLTATNEVTIEAWVKPANTTQGGPARIVTMSADPNLRDFTLAQDGNKYDTRLRTTSTSLNGLPSLSTPPGSATTALTHVVYTREHPSGQTKMYINNVLVATGSAVSSFNNWDSTMKLGLANEFTLDRSWLGEIQLVAIYDRDLSAAQVDQNFRAGPNPPTTPPAAWRLLPSNPSVAGVGGGGALARNTIDVYALVGEDNDGDSDSNQFWRFDVSLRQWVQRQNTPDQVGAGGALAWAGGDFIYALRGSQSDKFWRYSIGADSWQTSLPDAPQHVGWGGALTWDGADKLYALRGDNRKDLWAYSISGNSWSLLSQAPNNVKRGAALVHASGTLYSLRGENFTDFSKYNIGAGTWTALAPAPATVREGGSLAYAGGDYIYALRGNHTGDFWRYRISTNAWESLESTPTAVGEGGALEYLNGELYALRGDDKPDFWKFSPYR